MKEPAQAVFAGPFILLLGFVRADIHRPDASLRFAALSMTEVPSSLGRKF
jgi:hypothetical protein